MKADKDKDINEVAISIDVDSEVIEGVKNGEIDQIVLDINEQNQPFVIKNEDWSWFTCFLYFGLCLLLTPVLAIPFWVWWRSR